MKPLNIVVFGLSITSAWNNSHATTYRSLIKALDKRGHRITFFEKNTPSHQQYRDLPSPSFCETILYHSVAEIDDYRLTLAKADLVILGSRVTDAELLSKKITLFSPPCFAFYDLDTPMTLEKLQHGDYEYLTPNMITRFDLYLSCSAGPVLDLLEQKWGALRARSLLFAIDPDWYHPVKDDQHTPAYSLGYLGTYTEDRQPMLNKLLLEPAITDRDAKFCVSGGKYPPTIYWPDNVDYVQHIAPYQHCAFYHGQKFTLNIARKVMMNVGYTPSLRLFEAAACGTPIITNPWPGLEQFFTPGNEILVAQRSQDVLEYLQMPDIERTAIARRAQQKILHEHTSAHRALELEHYWEDVCTPVLAQAL